MKQLLELFRRPSPRELAIRELDQARRGLLEALSQQDFARALVQYHQDRIHRLTKTVEEDV